jgi:GT2 family glycosyltransferase
MSAPARIAVIIPTADRPLSLAECLRSLASSEAPVHRVLVVDASRNKAATVEATVPPRGEWPFCLEMIESPARTSAGQRNLGLRRVDSEDGILFIDDDAVVEPDCIGEMLAAFNVCGTSVAGVAANISNQPVGRLGLATRLAILASGGGWHEDYSGRLLGPAVGIRPRGDLSERFVEIEWASTTCVLYQREAMPEEGFRPFFSGYSLGEDMALSVDVRQKGKIVYASRARIVHTPRRTSKPLPAEYGRMEIVNRDYLMRRVLGRGRASHRAGFLAWVGWELASSLPHLRSSPGDWSQNWKGRLSGLWQVLS